MKFVPVRTYDNYVPAHIDMGILKDEGIESWLKDEHSVTVNPVLTNAVGGIKLMVPELQLQAAVDILIRKQAAYIGRQVCPNCESQQFLSKQINSRPTFWLESLMVFFLGKSILGTENVYYCMECNYEFKQPLILEQEEADFPD